MEDYISLFKIAKAIGDLDRKIGVCLIMDHRITRAQVVAYLATCSALGWHALTVSYIRLAHCSVPFPIPADVIPLTCLHTTV